jgi:hypothetical protein
MQRTQGYGGSRQRLVVIALAGLCWAGAGAASAQYDELPGEPSPPEFSPVEPVGPAGAAETAGTGESAGLAAVPVPEGWQPVGQVHRFGPDNLWDYINGADALFLDYGCLELLVQDSERDDLALAISIYDHGTPLNAFGIFRRDGGTSGQPVAGAGAAAVAQPPYRGLLLKDRFYVKLDLGAGELDHAGLATLLADIAGQLPGTDDLPAELSWLPDRHRQPNSLGFTRRDFLGLTELRDAVHATYTEPDAGTTYQLFSLRPDARIPAALGPRWQAEDRDGEQFYWRTIPYRGVVVMRAVPGRPLLGIAGLDDLDRARALLTAVTAAKGDL